MQHAFVVLHRPDGPKGPFLLYVAMTETRQQAIEAVRKFAPLGDLEINGNPLADKTAAALALAANEVRRL
jgi:hypothetical protein